jgi:hypothetical protein
VSLKSPWWDLVVYIQEKNDFIEEKMNKAIGNLIVLNCNQDGNEGN